MELRKIRNVGILVLAIALLCISLTACKQGSSGNYSPVHPVNIEDQTSQPSSDEPELIMANVSKVVDGDTIWVKYADYPNGIKCRYIGIDCPESVHSDESKNTEEGVTASKRNSELISSANSIVYLEFDAERYDQYGRLLAYVWIYDDSEKDYILIEDILLSEGLCKAVKYEPNVKYYDHFKELEDEARKNSIGFYGSGFYE